MKRTRHETNDWPGELYWRAAIIFLKISLKDDSSLSFRILLSSASLNRSVICCFRKLNKVDVWKKYWIKFNIRLCGSLALSLPGSTDTIFLCHESTLWTEFHRWIVKPFDWKNLWEIRLLSKSLIKSQIPLCSYLIYDPGCI